MSLVCPKCGMRLKALNVSKSFVCPACGTALEGHVTLPFIIGILLWSFIEAIIKQAIDPKFGLLASLLGMGIGACIGFPLMLWLMARLGEINAAPHESDGGLTTSISKRTDNRTGHRLKTVPPLSAQEKLQIKFRKSVRRGYVKNIEMDPVVPDKITAVAEPDETYIARVDSTKGQHYWFSDRRLLCEHSEGGDELLRYESVIKAHWMFKDRHKKPVMSLQEVEAYKQFKLKHFDRIEVELQDRLVVLEGLDQAYWPVLHFFWWLTRRSVPATPQLDTSK